MATQGARSRDRGVRLFLGNLSYDATEAHISQALQGCSGVLYVGIRRAPDTQKSRGHGQVEFASEEDALRALERLQGLEIKGRSVRVDWCEPPLRRKYAAGTQQTLGGPAQKEAASLAGASTIELFDADGCLTAAALSAAEGVTLGDLEQILDEIALLVPSTGSLLQQLLQEGPLLRAALLQAQLLLGRHGQLDLSNVSAAALRRAEGYATQRLLHECRALRPPTLPVLTVTSPPETLSKTSISTSSTRQKKSEVTKQPPVGRRPADPPRAAQPTDPCVIVSASSGGPSWRYSPAEDSETGVTGGINVSPLTPEPPASGYGDPPDAKGEAAGFAAAALPQKRKREGEGQQYVARSAEGNTEDNKRTRGASGAPAASSPEAALLAAEAAKVMAAPDHLVDELLRSQQLLHKVVQMSTMDLLQLDHHQRQQILSFRKALSLRGKFPGL
ncbi:hypothetical protein Esti_005110 [Eimeria stiedai]